MCSCCASSALVDRTANRGPSFNHALTSATAAPVMSTDAGESAWPPIPSSRFSLLLFSALRRRSFFTCWGPLLGTPVSRPELRPRSVGVQAPNKNAKGLTCRWVGCAVL